MDGTIGAVAYEQERKQELTPLYTDLTALINRNDKLQQMLDMQAKLQEALGYDIKNMTAVERTIFLKEFSIHLTQEIQELLYELPYFKPWKDYSNMTEVEIEEAMEKARKEFIDITHFFFNFALALNMSADDIHKAYYEKNIENYRRQAEGYTHDKSYR